MLFVSEKDEITGVQIKNTTVLKGQEQQQHAIYHVHCSNVNLENEYAVWIQMKRYNDFADYDMRIRAQIAATSPCDIYRLPNLPAKHSKSWTNHLSDKFIEKRRVLLDVPE